MIEKSLQDCYLICINMPTPDELALQRPEGEGPKKPPAEKPPDETDVALDQGNWNVIDGQLLQERRGGVVEVQEFSQRVATEPELGALATDEAALTDREIGAAQDRAKTSIESVKQEVSAAPAAEAPPVVQIEKVASAPAVAEAPPVQPAAEAKPAEQAPIAKAQEAAPAAESPAAPEARAESPREKEIKARMEAIHKEMMVLSARLRENPPADEAKKIRESRNQLFRESGQLRGELDSLEKKRQGAEAAQAEMAEVDKGWSEIHAAAMAGTEAAPSGEPVELTPIVAVGESPEAAEKGKQEKMKGIRSDIGVIAREIRASKGELSDEARTKLKDMSGALFDLETIGTPPAGLDELRKLHQELSQALFHAEKPQDRLKALAVLFQENPDLESAPAAGEETAEEAAEGEGLPEPEKRGVPESVPAPDADSFESLMDIDVQAFEIGEGDFAEFFKKDNGARYALAIAGVDQAIGARKAKIESLKQAKPDKPADAALLNETIAALEEANRLAELRKKQWETQKLLSAALDALPLHDAAISETQLELDEVNGMLENNPNDPQLIKQRVSLLLRLEQQGNESTRAYATVDKMRQDIEGLSREIAEGKQNAKARKETAAKNAKIQSDLAIYPERVTGTTMVTPEEALERAGESVERGLVSGVSTVVGIIHAEGGPGAALVNKASEVAKSVVDFVLKPPATKAPKK